MSRVAGGWPNILGFVAGGGLDLGFARGRCGRDVARNPAGFGFMWFRRGFGRAGLGLEAFQQPQGAPQLGERRAAIAQQRVERARAVAVADQGLAEIAVAACMAHEQVGFHALGALEPPGGAGDAAREQALQGAVGGQLLQQRRLERVEFLWFLVTDDQEFLGAKPVLQRVLRRARLALGCLGGRGISRRCGGSPRRARRSGRCPWGILEGGAG